MTSLPRRSTRPADRLLIAPLPYTAHGKGKEPVLLAKTGALSSTSARL
jgi:hypothetical protein